MEQLTTSKTIASDEPYASGDEVHVLRSTRLTSPKKPKSKQEEDEQDGKFVRDQAESTSSTRWLSHPKIRENYKVVIGAILLTVVGSVLFLVGVGIVISPYRGLHCLVFFIGGLLCLIPGAYHVVYIYLALKGFEGYSLYDLPVFN